MILDRAASKLPIDAARLRLQGRFHAKFPRAQPPQPAVVRSGAAAPNKNLDALEAARLRLRHRFQEKFPVASSPIPLTTNNHAINTATNAPLVEAARSRLRERFQRKFQQVDVPMTRQVLMIENETEPLREWVSSLVYDLKPVQKSTM